jgi:hypothetical protein
MVTICCLADGFQSVGVNRMREARQTINTTRIDVALGGKVPASVGL